MQVACRHCGAALNVPDKFAGKKGKCPKCGNVLLLTPAGPEGEKKPAEPAKQARSLELQPDRPGCCGNCGAKLPTGAIICVSCGTDVRTGKQLETRKDRGADEQFASGGAAPPRQRSSGRRVTSVPPAVVLVVLCLAFAGIGYFVQRGCERRKLADLVQKTATDEDVNTAMLDARIERDPEVAATVLATALQQEEAGALRLIEMVVKSKTDADIVLPGLRKLSTDHTSQEVRLAALAACLDVLPEERQGEVFAIGEAALDDEEKAVRLAALRLCMDVTSADDRDKRLAVGRKALADPAPELRTLGLQQMAQAGPQAVPVLCAYIEKQQDAGSRSAALKALAATVEPGQEDPQLLSVLIRGAQSGHRAGAKHSLAALRTIGRPAVEALINGFKQGEGQALKLCGALAEFGREASAATPVLLEAFDSTADEELASAAALAAADIGAPSGELLKRFAAALSDEEPAWRRRTGALALGKLGMKDAGVIRRLREIARPGGMDAIAALAADGQGDHRLRMAAIRALSQISIPESHWEFCRQVGDGDSWLKNVYGESLIFHGDGRVEYQATWPDYTCRTGKWKVEGMGVSIEWSERFQSYKLTGFIIGDGLMLGHGDSYWAGLGHVGRLGWLARKSGDIGPAATEGRTDAVGKWAEPGDGGARLHLSEKPWGDEEEQWVFVISTPRASSQGRQMISGRYRFGPDRRHVVLMGHGTATLLKSGRLAVLCRSSSVRIAGVMDAMN